MKARRRYAPGDDHGRLSTRAVDQLMDELATHADIIDEAGALALSTRICGHALPIQADLEDAAATSPPTSRAPPTWADSIAVKEDAPSTAN
ncbi:hypothetical protein SMD20_47710 [Nonomuraea sp. LP-02]|uniref:hypothetical protein n=1 Tax=Nonomuraea sp. LP-02 TaxID=3097960 RepID=UPI002E37EAE4|nr:hypothetical protein [Nonomuraea sp. LP-02]MED7931980.1 hypothetical protein [Nonomuraea sp. LP-02]